MSASKKKMYREEYYDLTEDEMQVLINRAKQQDSTAQNELLEIFSNFLSKYTAMIYHARFSLKDYDIRRFVALFVKDPGVRMYLLKNKLNPGGYKHVLEVMRGIQYMAQRYGCLPYETKIITSDGIKELGALVGKHVKVLSKSGRSNGGWKDAEIKSYGIQPLMKITLQRNKTQKTIYATNEHRWFVRDRGNGGFHGSNEVRTHELIAGDRLVSVFGHLKKSIKPTPYGVAAGILYGDGTAPKQNGSSSKVCLYGKKDIQLLKWFPELCSIRPIKEGTSHEGIEISGLPRQWKNSIDLSESQEFLYGWLAGYFAADGHIDTKGSASITSVDIWRLEDARNVCYVLGIPTLGITSFEAENGYHKNKKIYRLSFPVGALREDFFLLEEHKANHKHRVRLRRTILPDWKVVAIEESDRVEEVFCAVVPDTGAFALDDNILTGNSEEDIDQTVKMTFLQCVDRYQRAESKAGGYVPFSGYLYSYYFYLLKKNVDVFLIDQLGRKTFPLIADDDPMDEEGEKPAGFTAPPEPGVEDMLHAEKIDEYWVAGDTAQPPYDRLTIQERQLLKWRFADGERSSDIANRITEHPNTVREHFNRIRAKIRIALEEDGLDMV